MAPSSDTCTLTALLRRAGLEHLLPRFVEEDLTMPLLVSMGTQLRANLADMALSPDEIEAVAAALRHQADPLHEAIHGADPSAKAAGPPGCCSDADQTPASPASSMSADPLASFRQAVAELQAELYADDLEPPAGAHAWSAEQLRTYYETGGEIRPCGPPAPSQRGGSLVTGGLAADLEPRPGGSRLGGRLEAEVETEEVEAEEPPVVIRGDVVGTLHLKWQTHRADFDFAQDTTVGARDRYGCNPNPNP